MKRALTVILIVIHLTSVSCVNREVLSVGEGFPQQAWSPDDSAPRLNIPCVIQVSAPENFPGTRKSVIENPFLTTVYHYPLRNVLQKSFENSLYHIFKPHSGSLSDAFSITVSPSESNLQLSGNKAEFSLACLMTLRDPSGRIVSTETLRVFKTSSFDGASTPSAVYSAANQLAEAYAEALMKNRFLLSYKPLPASRTLAAGPDAPSSFDLSMPVDPVTNSWLNAKNTRLLSVGVSSYQDKSVPPVPYAENDATAFFLLGRAAGIPEENLMLLTNQDATRNIILEHLFRMMRMTTTPEERVIFYFSGHGSPLLQSGQVVDSILLPHDARGGALAATGLPINELRQLIAKSPGNWIVILDACFSGQKGRSVHPPGVRGLALVPSERVPPPDLNRWWITATSGSLFANDYEKQEQGLFTYYFLQSLRNPGQADLNGDGVVSLRESFEWSRKRIEEISRKVLGQPQEPEWSGKGDLLVSP